MAIPVIAATFGGVLLSSLATFLFSRFFSILAALGMSVGIYSGIDALINVVVNKISSLVPSGSVGFFGASIDAVGLIGSAGIFDAINIYISFFFALSVIKMSRVVVRSALSPK